MRPPHPGCPHHPRHLDPARRDRPGRAGPRLQGLHHPVGRALLLRPGHRPPRPLLGRLPLRPMEAARGPGPGGGHGGGGGGGGGGVIRTEEGPGIIRTEEYSGHIFKTNHKNVLAGGNNMSMFRLLSSTDFGRGVF